MLPDNPVAALARTAPPTDDEVVALQAQPAQSSAHGQEEAHPDDEGG